MTELQRAVGLVREFRDRLAPSELQALLRMAFPSIGLVPIFLAASERT